VVSRGSELDDAFENERELQLREIFENSVNHSYVTNPAVLADAYEVMLFGFFPTEEELETERHENFQIARESFYDMLHIDAEDFDWAAWKEVNGY
jgi:hypothetical protein